MTAQAALPAGYDLAGRVAIVTGGGTGLGAAMAASLAAYGASVAIAGRRPGPLEKTAAEIDKATGRACLVIPADVRQPEEVARLVERVIGEFGRIDILVNNAGGARRSSLAQFTPEQWEGEFALNTHAAFLC